MLKSLICIYLTVFVVFCSVSSSASSDLSKKVHILIGDVDGAKITQFDKIELISFWFRQRGIGVVTHFAAVERDLEEVLRHPYTAGIIWIGHSDPLGGVLDANGRKIPKSTFNNISRSVATMFFVSCCAKSVVFPFYGIRQERPEIDLYSFDAAETNGVIYFEKHMKAFFRTENAIWEELVSSINSHQLRLSRSCRASINEY